MDSSLFSALFEEGVLGIIIVAQGYWIVRQEQRYDALREQGRADLLEAQAALLRSQQLSSDLVSQLRPKKDRDPPSKP